MSIPMHMFGTMKTPPNGGGGGGSSSPFNAVAATLRLRRKRPGTTDANVGDSANTTNTSNDPNASTNGNHRGGAWRNPFSPPRRAFLHRRRSVAGASEAEESESDAATNANVASPSLRPALLRSLTAAGGANAGAPPQLYLPPRHSSSYTPHTNGYNGHTHLHRDMSVPETTQLDAISLESAPHVAVRYGDTIRLFARSKYADAADAGGGYVGTFEAGRRLFKPSKASSKKQGELACLPPVRGAPYRPSAFTILSTTGADVGSPVSYGDVVVLVDDRGRVWNNKIGVGPSTLNGYFGPREQNTPGEMYLSFHQLTDEDDDRDSGSSSDSDSDTETNFLSLSSLARTTKTMAETTFGKPTQVEMELAAAALRTTTTGRVMYYGDRNVIIDVADSNRLRSKFNRVVTHFRKNDESAAHGGYLRCDGRGKAILFELHGQPIASVQSIDVSDPEVHEDDDADLTADDDEQRERTRSPSQDVVTHSPATLRVASSGGSIAVGRPLEIRDVQPTSVVSLLFSDGGLLKIPCSRFQEAAEKPFYRVVLGGQRPLRLQLHAVKSTRRKGKVSIRKTLRETYQELAKLYGGVVIVSSAAAFVLSKVLGLTISLPAMYLGGVTVFCVFLLELYHPGRIIKSNEPQKIVGPGGENDVDYYGDWKLSILVVEASATERIECESSSTVSSSSSLSRRQSSMALRVPQCFVMAENGDLAKATERYHVTQAWRKELNVDSILTTPQIHFSTIKQYYHQYLHKTDRLGHPVYFEKIGNINMKGLLKEGITQDDLFRHYVFAMEFTLKYAANKLCPCPACASSETQKMFIVLDARGIGMKDLSGDGAEFIRRCTGIMQRHYPQRSYKIFFVNVPSWFGMAWKGIKPLLNETTRAKTNILTESETPQALLELIDAENLPVEYGGTCTCVGGCEENSAYQRLQKKLVESVISCRPFAPEDIDEVGLERPSSDGGLDSEAEGMRHRDSASSTGMTELSSIMGASNAHLGGDLAMLPPGFFRDEVLHAGYLLKRPMKHNHFTPIWNRRFFILHPDSLRFGKVPKAEVYQIVQLTIGTVVRKTLKGTNTFELVTPLMAKSGHSLVLYAANSTALNKWVDIIQQAIDKLSGKPAPVVVVSDTEASLTALPIVAATASRSTSA